MLSQRKVLVVEDNMLNRCMLCDILSQQYTVLEAENGLEALDVLEKYGENLSLILLDIVMPVMDGYTFLSHMKANSAYSSIPVIVITQSDSEADEITALAHGANDFVSKPYKPQIILYRAASIINFRENMAMMQRVQYDRLTGFYSKEYFFQSAKNMIIQHPDQKYDIVCSDIENFKLINDIFGIPAGDRLLREVAGVYTDLVGDRGICCRVNADKFVCLVERGIQYTNEMFINADDRIHALANMKSVVMKWGIYQIEERTFSIEQMCDWAFLAVRSIRGKYGEYFAVFQEEMRNKLIREQALTEAMETALDEKQFKVYMQPQYQIRDSRMIGAEALVRWIHPEWGVQSPGEFIPLFEKNGFITKLDQYVWDRVCAILREWEDKGYPPISVSVNVSRADIYNVELPNIMMKLIKRHGISPDKLHLEITESAYTEDPGQIIETVSKLRELGFIVEMDDFGSGYSSLNMLNNLPIDVLKLDMGFIRSETARPASEGIIRFIVQLAHSMKLHVVAEGVETKEQLNRLSDIGCDFVQGYYFAKPMPYWELEPFLKDS